MQFELWQIGIALIFLGIFLIFVGIPISQISEKKTKVEAGFIAFIGPIPIGFATSKEILYISLIISLALLILLVIYLKFFLP